jgi:hypothetical protein
MLVIILFVVFLISSVIFGIVIVLERIELLKGFILFIVSLVCFGVTLGWGLMAMESGNSKLEKEHNYILRCPEKSTSLEINTMNERILRCREYSESIWTSHLIQSNCGEMELIELECN